MSCTTFTYSELRVTNLGTRTGDEVVQLYVRDEVASLSRPVMQLRAFAKLHLAPDESREVSFPLTAGHHPAWRSVGGTGGEWWIDLGQPLRVSTIDLRERIEEGQRVSRYRVEGHDGTRWQLLSAGGTIGYQKLDRIQPRRVRRVRVQVLEGIEAPLPLTIGLYDG